MNTQRVILLTHGGPEIKAATDLLAEWARRGLVHPFIYYTDERHTVYLDDHGAGPPTSVFEILGRQELAVIRIAALAGPDEDDVGELADMIRTVVDTIKNDLAPEGLRVVEVRIWAPYDPRPDEGWAAPKRIFSSTADANLVLVPEDRQTEGKVGIPLSRSDRGVYGSHVATEAATALGMWSGMSEAPVDAMEGGVHGFGGPKVHLARSFVRAAEIPAVSLAGAADHGGMLRVPPGCQEAPYPFETLASAQSLIGGLLDRELVKNVPPARPERVGPAKFMRGIVRGMVGSLRHMFTISRDVIAALRDMAGHTLQEAVGKESVLRLVWRGRPSKDEEDTGGEEAGRFLDAEELIAELRRRRMLEGGIRIDQDVWANVGKAVFSLADGGETPEGVPAHMIGDRVAIAKEVGMIAPAHGPDLAADIERDSEEETPATLLGRIGAHLRRAERRSRRGFDDLVEQSKSLLNVEHPPALTTAGVVVAGLITLVVAGLLLLTGLVELAGITEMRRAARALVWAVATAAYLLMLAALSRVVAARFKDEHEDEPQLGPRASDAEKETAEGEDAILAELERSLDAEEEEAEEQETEGAEKKRPPSAWRLWWRKAKKWSSDSPNFNVVIALAALVGLAAALSVAVASRFGGQVSATTESGAFNSVAASVGRWLLAREDLVVGITLALIVYAILLAFQLDRKPYRSVETFRQARMLFFVTVLYGAFGLVGVAARADGWYGGQRSEGFDDYWITLSAIVAGIIVLMAAMAFDGYRRASKMRTTVSDLERRIEAAVATQWATKEAFEQFLGSAAAWAAVMWKPFGEFDPGRAGGRDGFTCEVLKAETRPFLVTSLGEMAMRERMMKELAKPGWLGRRYQTAVEAYRRRRAVETGTEPASILPPDQDPREVHTIAWEDRPKVSGRWRFARDLTAGAYDQELGRALDALDHANAAEWVYKQEGTLEAAERGGEPLEEYLGSVVSRAASKASFVYFETDARMDADLAYRPTLWWPSGLLDRPDGGPAQESQIRSLVNGDLVIMSVRHDLAGPYTRENLFEPAEAEPDPEAGEEEGQPLHQVLLRRLRESNSEAGEEEGRGPIL